MLIGTLGELGIVGLVLLAMFLGPLIIRKGYGPEAAAIRAALASLVVAGLFLDVLSNRKQVWLLIGIAAGLRHLASGERAAAGRASGVANPRPDAARTAQASRRRVPGISP